MQGEADATLKELWWLLGDERNLFLIVGLHRGIALRRHFLLSRMFRRMAGIEPRELRFERGHLWLLGPSSDQD